MADLRTVPQQQDLSRLGIMVLRAHAAGNLDSQDGLALRFRRSVVLGLF